jgi:hypothetical protein
VDRPLVVLENDELRAELADVVLEIEDARLLCCTHENNDRLADFQAELKRLESLQKQRRQKQVEVDQLAVRAPISGQVIGRNLDAFLATYVTRGAEVMSIGNRQAKEIQVSVAQEDLEAFADHLQKPVVVRVSGVGRFSSVLESVSPQASIRPLHAAICAPNGGPLAVRRKGTDADLSQGDDKSYEVIAPRFLAIVVLDERHSSPLWAGQRGVATFRDAKDTIGKHLYQSLRRWLRDKFAAASNTS